MIGAVVAAWPLSFLDLHDLLVAALSATRLLAGKQVSSGYPLLRLPLPLDYYGPHPLLSEIHLIASPVTPSCNAYGTWILVLGRPRSGEFGDEICNDFGSARHCCDDLCACSSPYTSYRVHEPVASHSTPF